MAEMPKILIKRQTIIKVIIMINNDSKNRELRKMENTKYFRRHGHGYLKVR